MQSCGGGGGGKAGHQEPLPFGALGRHIVSLTCTTAMMTMRTISKAEKSCWPGKHEAKVEVRGRG